MKLFLTPLLLILLIQPEVLSNASVYSVMSYNIRYDNPDDGEDKWVKRREFLAEQIKFYEPDIIGTQEGMHHQLQYLDSALNDYEYVGISREKPESTQGEFNAIFYNKHKLEVVETNTFWLSETPDKPSVGWDAMFKRICTYVLFKDKSNGKLFYAFNTHFDHVGKQARVESAELIHQKIREINRDFYPFFLTGDFNLQPETAPIQILSRHLLDTGNGKAPVSMGPEGTFNGFKFSDPVKERIDYIFIPRQKMKLLKYATLSDSKNLHYPSDHLPVMAVVVIE